MLESKGLLEKKILSAIVSHRPPVFYTIVRNTQGLLMVLWTVSKTELVDEY